MRVVPINSPRLERAFHNEVMAGAANVVHDLLASTLLNGLPNARAERFHYLGPRRALPFAATARANTLHGIKNAIRILNLIDGGWTLRAKTPAAGRMFRIAFEFRNLA